MSTPLTKQFNYIYEAYYKRAYVFVKSYVHDDFIAEDIVSEALIKLWETMKNEEVKKPLNLLLKILKNKSLDYLRHSAIHIETIETISDWHQRELNVRISTLQACDPDEIFMDEIQSIVNKTLASLPEQTRRIFEMSRFEQISEKEIAQKLHISVKGVDYHISKALKSLRISLKDYLPILYFLFLS